MADIGHSILLKFFVDRSNMSEAKPDIESSVPNSQELRGSSNLEQNTVEELENAVYSPVITVTKEETSLTKGDLKVHKVVVSEDVSDDSIKINRSTSVIETRGTNDDSRVESKVYVSVKSEQGSFTTDNDKNIFMFEGVNGNDDQKVSRKTRIPKRKFKQAVDKIKKEEQIIQERITHDEPNLDIKITSSIPRLKEIKEIFFKHKEDSQKLDDEFDKLYEETKDNNADVRISTPESLRDAEIVDSIFEEIIHAYDEKVETSTEKVHINTENIENNNDKIEMSTKKVQMSTEEKTNTEKVGNGSEKVETNTEKPKSKIPLLKRKSEQEIKLPINRRSSLKKSISIDDSKIPIQSKSTAKIDLAHTKNPETCSTINKLESDLDKKTESFESKMIIKTIKTQQSIEMEHSNVSSKELPTTSNEVSKCKIPVKSHTKDKIQKLNSATLNKLPAKSNIIEKIVSQHTTSEVSKSSLDTEANETHRISRDLIEKALQDHQGETRDIKNSEKIEEKLTNQQISAQENQSIINTDNKISQSGISVSENSQISSNEIQETNHSTNSQTVTRSFTVTSTQWDNLSKNLFSSENNHINMDLASIKNSDEIKESINDNNIITEISKTDVESQTIKKTEIKETIRVSTLEYDSSIDFKTENTNNNEISDSEDSLNNSNIKMKEKEIISNIISKENHNEIKSDMTELVKSGEAHKLETIRTETNLIDIQKKDNTSFKNNEESENKTSEDIKTKSENTNKVKYDSKEINNNKNFEAKDYSKNTFISLHPNLQTEGESKTNNRVIAQKIANRIESITGNINKTDNIIKENKVTANKPLNIVSDKLKDDKEINSITLNVNNKISSQIENIDELNEEDIIILRGKVNRIISRLDSREVKIEKTENDIPKNISIDSKIAIFENNESENLKNGLQNIATNETTDDDKPKIVDEILKCNENIITEKTITRDTILDIYDNNKENKFDYHTVFNKVHSSVLRRLKSLEMNSKLNLKDVINQENLIDKEINQNISKPSEGEKREINKIYENISKINGEEQRKFNSIEVNKKETIKDEYNRTKSLAELHFEGDSDRNIFDNKNKKKLQEDKRAKSLAQLDLENVMKGRVRQMVLRMNSIEQINKERRELERNRPKRSVLSRAAVFEKKVVPDKVENVTKTDRGRSNEKVPEIGLISEEEFQERIAELNSAKAKYGKWENMPTIELRDGSLMPVLAVGTALLEPKLIKHIISTAIDLGYRAIDTAFIYGNEKEIGEAIKSKIEDGTVKREDLFIISKLWSTFHRRDLVETACRLSLDSMGLEYFDLYMIHNPMSFREGSNPLPKIANVLQYSQYDYLEAWYGMENVVAKGLVKRVGLSNFNSAQVDRIIEKAKIKPVINQVECHPYLNQHNLEDFCTTRNMKLSCFSVLGSKGTPKDLKSATSAVIDDPLVQVMAAGLGVTPAQLLIAYQLHHGRNVVVKSSTGAHLWDNLRALDLKLNQTQVSALDALNKNKRTFTFKGMGDTHKNYPFKTAF
ncbi:unnamed protein product, partial [Brenthis ino]